MPCQKIDMELSRRSKLCVSTGRLTHKASRKPVRTPDIPPPLVLCQTLSKKGTLGLGLPRVSLEERGAGVRDRGRQCPPKKRVQEAPSQNAYPASRLSDTGMGSLLEPCARSRGVSKKQEVDDEDHEPRRHKCREHRALA